MNIKQVELLKKSVEKWNRYRRIFPTAVINLGVADLSGVNLYSANLFRANLCNAYLRGANLCSADLRGANLCSADLRGADLREADIDFSCLPLWCGSIGVKVDAKIARQIAYHLCALDCDDGEFIEVKKHVADFANKFHKVKSKEVDKIIIQ